MYEDKNFGRLLLHCVSGVPLQDEDHAHNSVQMGLDMITLIQVIKMMPQIVFLPYIFEFKRSIYLICITDY